MRALINSFSEPLLTRLVTAFTIIDRIEAEVAAATRPNGAAYQLQPGPHKREQLRAQYIRGCDCLDATLQALQQEWPLGTLLSQPPLGDPATPARLAAVQG